MPKFDQQRFFFENEADNYFLKKFFSIHNLIGLSSPARGGKNTAQSIISNIAEECGFVTLKLALAKKLKDECFQYLYNTFGISSYTENTEEKTKIRDFLVQWGKDKRKVSKGKYFTDHINSIINAHKEKIAVISDIRYFNEYKEDEFIWLKNNKGILIYIERILPDGSILGPANEDEFKNNILLKQNANILITWPTTNDNQLLINLIKQHLIEFIKKSS